MEMRVIHVSNERDALAAEKESIVFVAESTQHESWSTRGPLFGLSVISFDLSYIALCPVAVAFGW